VVYKHIVRTDISVIGKAELVNNLNAVSITIISRKEQSNNKGWG
jgi:hypothetical protein